MLFCNKGLRQVLTASSFNIPKLLHSSRCFVPGHYPFTWRQRVAGTQARLWREAAGPSPRAAWFCRLGNEGSNTVTVSWNSWMDTEMRSAAPGADGDSVRCGFQPLTFPAQLPAMIPAAANAYADSPFPFSLGSLFHRKLWYLIIKLILLVPKMILNDELGPRK